MKIGLAVRHQGEVPSFKNNKRTIKLKNGGTMPVTDRRTKKWMNACIRSFESQLFCLSRATDAETQTALSQLFWTVSSRPSETFDDSIQWIPEINIKVERVDAGNEGASIVIEQITTPNGSESNQTKET